MKQGLFIGELSRLFNVPTQTIRYYERLGLIEPSARTESQYRVYLDEDIDRLRFILQAKRFGLSLHEIKELMELSAEGTPPCGRLKELLQKHLKELDERIQEMVDLRNELSRRYQKVEEANLDDFTDGTICKIIEQEPLN